MRKELVTTLSSSSMLPKPIPTAIAPLLPHPMRNSRKPSATAKNFAPASSNSSI